ncbi:MAG: Abi family protein [Prevotella sp.]|nr:Abi family protein [Prevotella sp.]
MSSRIPFQKPYTSAHDLVSLLQSRGLTITDGTKAEQYLEYIGYYRLSAYMYPLLQMPKEQHRYKPNTTFESWLTIVTLTRNSCCHHARVWNKQNTIRPMIPNRMTGNWITLPTDALRIYFNLCIIKYFLNIISPNNDMKSKMDALLSAYPSIDTAAMGFPRGWENEPLWQ